MNAHGGSGAGPCSDAALATFDSHGHLRANTRVLTLAALGVVFGDIGTSPLYTFKTVLELAGGAADPAVILGSLSLVVWTLIVVTSIKYVSFAMRVDNDGEGGILALMSLLGLKAGKRPLIVAAGLFGAALIYGDGAITPAISVLSAVEGVGIAAPAFARYVLPATVLILVALFAIQPQGTHRIGRAFGPIMVLWFAVIGTLGLWGIVRHPGVLAAIDPRYGLRYLANGGSTGFEVLGGVFLCVTGAEALYADMGHFGARPIRLGWYALVFPSLLLNYAGQAALVLAGAPTGDNIFYRLCPPALVIPLVVLATVATIIASQAIITGAFSMTRQAMQLGWFPSLMIRQTSDQEYGQIYVPLMNWALMVCTIALTVTFGSSSRLAGAYGTAVSTTMLLTTVLLFNAMRDVWRWRTAPALAVCAVFLIIDLAFFAANLLKIAQGGWVPLLLSVLMFVVMTTWRKGIHAIHQAQEPESVGSFLARLQRDNIPRVPGTAVFFSRSEFVIPPVLVRHVAQMKALQRTVVSLTVQFEKYPRVPADQRTEIKTIADGLWHVTVRFGFIERPSVTAAIASAREKGCPLDLDDAVYFAAHDEVVRNPQQPRLPAWRRKLFAPMYGNAVKIPDLFDLPKDAFLEVGRQIAL